MCRIVLVLFLALSANSRHAIAAEPTKSNSTIETLVAKIEKETSSEKTLEHVKAIETHLVDRMRADQRALKDVTPKDFSYENSTVSQALSSAENYFIFKPILDYHLHRPKEEAMSKEGCRAIENEVLYSFSFGRPEGELPSGDTELALKIHRKICGKLK
ncbi:MAG: hypothetical protein KDD38_06480 [Bdellovibrionales bacterium]|nr:hypothetical protein [Bdellovibrionales bacterium]